MPAPQYQELFERLSAELSGLDLSDDDLRRNRIFIDDPRNDIRYVPGPPPENVQLVQFANAYKLSSGLNQMRCMFSEHRHFNGVSFLFSDGSLRCIGPDCFAELSVHAGLDLIGLKSAISNLKRRQGSIDALEISAASLEGVIRNLESVDISAQCQDHFTFKNTILAYNPRCWKFLTAVASDNGKFKIKDGKWTVEDDPKAELITISGSSALNRFPVAEMNVKGIVSGSRKWLGSYRNTDSRAGSKAVRDVQESFRELLAAHRDIIDLLDKFDVFLAGDGLRSMAQAWNSFGSGEHKLLASRTSLTMRDKTGNVVSVLSLRGSKIRAEKKAKTLPLTCAA